MIKFYSVRFRTSKTLLQALVEGFLIFYDQIHDFFTSKNICISDLKNSLKPMKY